MLDIRSNSGLEIVVHNLSNIPVVDISIDENLLDLDKDRFEGDIYLPEWEELILAIESDSIDDPVFRVMTSYYIQATRRGVVSDLMSVGTSGVIVTSDNKIVYGIRGGKVEVGKASIAPNGGVRYSESDNLILNGFYEELREELGILPEKLSTPKLIGYHTDPDFGKGVSFVFLAETPYSSSDLVSMHSDAFKVYSDAKSLEGELSGRKALAQSDVLNVDAWEHERLVFVSNDSDSIKEVINSRTLCGAPLLDAGRTPLTLYSQYQE